MNQQPTLAIFGGTFDPIHFGHLRAAQEAAMQFGLDHVVFMPSAQPPHRKEVKADTAHRLAMAEMAVAGNCRFQISDLETRRSGSSYSVHTLQQLRRKHPGHRLVFLLGTDAFFQIHTWFQAEELFNLADFIVMDRPGTPRYDILTYLQDYFSLRFEALGERGAQLPGLSQVKHLTTTLLDISSSDIKRQVALGNSITYLLPSDVEEYILKHGLYKQR